MIAFTFSLPIYNRTLILYKRFEVVRTVCELMSSLGWTLVHFAIISPEDYDKFETLPFHCRNFKK